MGKFQLFPEQASTLAPEVDHLLYFLLAVTVFFTLLIFGAIFYFADPLPAPFGARTAARPAHRLHAGDSVERDSLRPHHGDVHLGRQHLLQRPAGRRTTPSRSTWSASSGCGSWSTWKASARSTNCTSRWARPVKLTMTSEDVIHSFFVPAFRTKQDVVPGRYSTTWFTAHQAGQVSPVLRRVLRHQPFRHDRLGLRDGAAGLSELAERRRRRRLAGGERQEAVRAAGLHQLSQGRQLRPRPQPGRRVRQARCNWPAAAP